MKDEAQKNKSSLYFARDSEHLIRSTKIGILRFDLSDPYHVAMDLSWPQFFIGLTGIYLLVNILFASLYFASPEAISNLPPGSFLYAFFFSVETLTTVGYGAMAPHTTYGHTLVTVELFISLLLTATTTGLIFVRFSKAKAKILFAKKVAVSRDLPLLSDELSYFSLTWTLTHAITEESPLKILLDQGAQAIAELPIWVLLHVRALDNNLGASVHDTRMYTPADFVMGAHYADIMTLDSAEHVTADMTKVGEIEVEVDGVTS